MDKYTESHGYGDQGNESVKMLRAIANELAERNRLKRVELLMKWCEHAEQHKDDLDPKYQGCPYAKYIEIDEDINP